jgi:L-ribulokinase
MQIYADVTGREIKVAAAKQTPALGSAMFGAVAATKAAGGFDTIFEASKAMAHQREEVYTPHAARRKIYDELFAEYKLLHNYFGGGENDVMKRLKSMKARVRGAK